MTDGHCLRKSMVYQGTVTTEDSKPDETYVGLTENTIKTRPVSWTLEKNETQS